LVPALYNKASLGRNRPYAIVNTTTNLFRTNPLNAQSGIHMRGVTFIGSGTNKMFDVTGQTPLTDYFNVTASGCAFKNFGDRAIDGSLGSWLWKFDNCEFHAQDYLAVYLYQPHGAVIEQCGFWYRNKQDLKTVGGGASFKFINNAHDFDVGYKEIGLEFDSPLNLICTGNYSEEYEYGAPLVNDGRGTDVVVITVDHYSPNTVQQISNNYYAASHVQRLFTVKRDSAEQGFHTKCQLKIGDNTVNGLAGDYLYHDHTGAGTLTMPRPALQAAQTTAYTISDTNGSLRFTGPNALSVLRYAVTSPANNAQVAAVGELTTIRNDKNFSQQADGWTVTGAADITITFSWASAEDVDFFVNISSTGTGNFSTVPLRQTGKKGGGTFRYTVDHGLAPYVKAQLTNVTGSSAVCDSMEVNIAIKSLER
jgi:hypothetical protein